VVAVTGGQSPLYAASLRGQAVPGPRMDVSSSRCPSV
jgi:hypothetical protein